MLLSLDQVQQIATEVIREEHPELEVIGARTSVGGSPYTEVTVTLHGCRAEPCVIVIGAERNASEATFRSAVAKEVDEHLRHHR